MTWCRCFWFLMDLFMTSRTRVDLPRLQYAPEIPEGEAVTNSNSWI